LGSLVSTVVKTFNDTLTLTLRVKGDQHKVILIDEFTFMDQTVANFQSEGFTTAGTGSACNPQAEIAIATGLGLSDPSFFGDSLFCSPQTLVAPNADQTFIFADKIHPTTHYSNLFAKFVEQQIAASGLGR
jgi:phospholipase/lecithinase/hemolysin